MCAGTDWRALFRKRWNAYALRRDRARSLTIRECKRSLQVLESRRGKPKSVDVFLFLKARQSRGYANMMPERHNDPLCFKLAVLLASHVSNMLLLATHKSTTLPFQRQPPSLTTLILRSLHLHTHSRYKHQLPLQYTTSHRQLNHLITNNSTTSKCVTPSSPFSPPLAPPSHRSTMEATSTTTPSQAATWFRRSQMVRFSETHHLTCASTAPMY